MKNKIKQFVEANPQLVSKKETSLDGVFVLKYKNRVFYKNLWTPELLECRGTLIDDDYNIIQRPFTKIFNRNENNTDIDPHRFVYCVEKINGFMACGTWHNDELLVSTTGTIDSDFAKLAKVWLEPYKELFKEYKNYSLVFEIVDNTDPHIIQQKEGVYLLGGRIKTWFSKNHTIFEAELDELANKYGIMRPNWKICEFSDVVEEVKTVKHEGFVCWDGQEDVELKIKSPFYLMTKFFGRISDNRFNNMLQNPTSAKKTIDEEFYDVIDYLAEHKDKFLSLDRPNRIKFVRDFIETLYKF
jgi:hypothetical protein